jgi:peptidoglycan/xylan/chitin deacetylase (PgdA/CDA1 family)
LNLNVSLDNFRDQLQLLTTRCTPVSLRELVALRNRKKSLKGLVALTFDDGYKDFAVNAIPELAAMEIPATIFVTTGYIGAPFWWDEVSELLRPQVQTVDRLEIVLDAASALRVFENMTDEESAAEAVRRICDDLLYLDPARRSTIIAGIREQTGLARDSSSTPRAMSLAELEGLATNPRVEIAAHSVTHPMLARLDRADQRREIRDSYAALEQLAKPVFGFSYPNGSYCTQTCELVKETGYSYACTSRQGVVRRNTDCYRLPRIWAPNTNGRAFRHWLSAWSGTLR